VARTRAYRDGRLVAEHFPVADVSEHLDDPETTVWIDLCAPQHDELSLLAEELQLHALAVEDAIDRRERPKLDRYPSHLFLTAFQVRLSAETGRLSIARVSAFITKRALVTVRKSEAFDIDAVVARWDASAELTGHGVGFLLHGLLDYVVDSHFEVVERLDEEIETLEDMVFDERPRNAEVQRRSFEMRKSLVLLRRVTLPMREVLNTLMRDDSTHVARAMFPYYQDVYDHVLRAGEWTESLRDLVATVLDTNLTIQGNKLNTIMKQVTSWAAIIAVPTAITGFYGQNVPYPGYGHASGFWISTVLIAALSAGLWWMFRKRGWL
jgi:magnesium transporter